MTLLYTCIIYIYLLFYYYFLLLLLIIIFFLHIWYLCMTIKRPCYFGWIHEFNSKVFLKIHSICNNLFCIYFTFFFFLPSQDRWYLIYLFIFLRSFCVFIFRLLQHYLCTPFSINFTVTVVIDVVLFVDCERFEFKIVNLFTYTHTNIHIQLSWFNRLIIIELFCIELYIIGAICKLFIRCYKIVFNCFVYKFR